MLIIHKITKTSKFSKNTFWAHIWAPMQPPPTFNFGLASNFLFVFRILSMRQKYKKHQNQGSIDKKFDFFSPVPNSHTQMGSLSAKNASEKLARLGTFNKAVWLLAAQQNCFLLAAQKTVFALICTRNLFSLSITTKLFFSQQYKKLLFS